MFHTRALLFVSIATWSDGHRAPDTGIQEERRQVKASAGQIKMPQAGSRISLHLLKTHPELPGAVQTLVGDTPEMLERISGTVTIPVIVISGEFSGPFRPPECSCRPILSRSRVQAEELFENIGNLVHELPTRPKTGKSQKAARWVKNDKATIPVTCSERLRTFPVSNVSRGHNEAE